VPDEALPDDPDEAMRNALQLLLNRERFALIPHRAATAVLASAAGTRSATPALHANRHYRAKFSNPGLQLVFASALIHS
jgi:hypothetical protein